MGQLLLEIYRDFKDWRNERKKRRKLKENAERNRKAVEDYRARVQSASKDPK